MKNPLEDVVLELLEHNKGAVHPGNGKKDAALIRKVCNKMGIDEDEYLPTFVKRNKKDWGL